MGRKVAFVTGASRGIGKACAIHLARAGFDVAVTARTVHEGEEREHSSTLRASNTKPLPGSLSATAALIEAAGVRALALPADLLDHASLAAAATTVLERWGRVDVLVQNGRYIGPGHMDRFLDTPLELLDKHLQANVLAPLVLAKRFLPGMLERGEGRVLDVTSAAAYGDPPRPAGEGGWGMGYGISKAAFHRIAGFLAVELGRARDPRRESPARPRPHRAPRGRHGRVRLHGRRAARRDGRGRRLVRVGAGGVRVQRPDDRGAVLLPRPRAAARMGGPVGRRGRPRRSYDLAGARLADLEDRRRRELGISR